MTTTREQGAKAEEIAASYLMQQGYEILEKNWTNNHHELDLIARKQNVLVIVEVKSLSSTYYREPYESVNRNKQRLIILATNAYIRRHNINDEVRFDIISITFGPVGPQIEHIENAFYPKVK